MFTSSHTLLAQNHYQQELKKNEAAIFTFILVSLHYSLSDKNSPQGHRVLPVNQQKEM